MASLLSFQDWPFILLHTLSHPRTDTFRWNPATGKVWVCHPPCRSWCIPRPTPGRRSTHSLQSRWSSQSWALEKRKNIKIVPWYYARHIKKAKPIWQALDCLLKAFESRHPLSCREKLAGGRVGVCYEENKTVQVAGTRTGAKECCVCALLTLVLVFFCTTLLPS